MRQILAFAFLLFATPALAQYWTHYANEEPGYEIDIPPGFGDENENDGGVVFYRIDAEQALSIFGGRLSGDLEAEAMQALDDASAQNWGITAQSSTPQWASFSGQRDHRLFHQRMILLCDGSSFAAFRLEYNIGDLAQMTPVVEGLVRSFVPTNC